MARCVELLRTWLLFETASFRFPPKSQNQRQAYKAVARVAYLRDWVMLYRVAGGDEYFASQ